MSKLSSPSSAGGTVAGVGGGGGSVGTSVGLTTASHNRQFWESVKQKKLEVFSSVNWCMRALSCHKLALNWHRGCYHTCPLLHADSRSLQVGGLGEHCGVVESVRGQAIEAVITRRASDSNLLSATLGGWRRRESRLDRLRLQLPKQIQCLIQLVFTVCNWVKHLLSKGLTLSL